MSSATGAGPVAARITEETNAALAAAAAALEDSEYPRSARQLRVAAAAFELESPLRVVVAGEAGQGKSTLVNALAEMPGLICPPEGSGTTAFVDVQHGTSGALAHIGESDGITPIMISEVAGWAADKLQDRSLAGRIEVWTPGAPAGMLLVDTPAIGRARATSGELVLREVRRADALLLVSDSRRGLTKTEMDFLELASERIGAIAVVQTRIDEIPGWMTVLQENKVKLSGLRLATQHAVPIFSLSAAEAEDSFDEACGEEARRLARRAGSGLPALIAHLDGELRPRRDQLREANALGLAKALVAEARELEHRRGTALLADQGAGDQLRDLHSERERLKQAVARADARLEREFRELQREILRRLRARIDELRDQFVERADHTLFTQVRSIEKQCQQALLGLGNEMCDELVDETERIARDAVVEIDASVSFESTLELSEEAVRRISDLHQGMGPADVISGLPAITIAHSVIGLALASVPGIGVIAVLGGALIAARKQYSDKAGLRGWVQSQTSTAESSLREQLTEGTHQMRQAVTTHVHDQARARDRNLTALISAATMTANAGKAERDRAVSTARSRLTALDESLTRLEAALAAVGGG